MNSAIHQLLKFSLRCWKHRNHQIYGTTCQEKQQQALLTTHNKIMQIYSSPPTLDPQFRSIFDVPLAQCLCLPLQAAEKWLSLIDHQIRVTKHNLKILLRQHVPMPRHLSNMELEAAKQAVVRNQYPSKDTPQRARHRAIQFANKAMRAKLYLPRNSIPQSTARDPLNDALFVINRVESPVDPPHDALLLGSTLRDLLTQIEYLLKETVLRAKARSRAGGRGCNHPYVRRMFCNLTILKTPRRRAGGAIFHASAGVSGDT